MLDIAYFYYVKSFLHSKNTIYLHYTANTSRFVFQFKLLYLSPIFIVVHPYYLLITSSEGTSCSNPLLVLVQAIPNNIGSVFSENGRVLSIVFLAGITEICINTLGDEILVLKKLLQDINKIITTFLSFVITKFGPIAIFVLITRTFAICGVEHLKPALAYVCVTSIALLLFLTVGYALFIYFTTGLNPFIFVKKATVYVSKSENNLSEDIYNS